jgi:hypothetical protein
MGSVLMKADRWSWKDICMERTKDVQTDRQMGGQKKTKPRWTANIEVYKHRWKDDISFNEDRLLGCWKDRQTEGTKSGWTDRQMGGQKKQSTDGQQTQKYINTDGQLKLFLTKADGSADKKKDRVKELKPN